MTTITNPHTGKISYVYSPVELEEFRLRQITKYQVKNGERFSQSAGSIYDTQLSRNGNRTHKNKLTL